MVHYLSFLSPVRTRRTHYRIVSAIQHSVPGSFTELFCEWRCFMILPVSAQSAKTTTEFDTVWRKC